MSVAIATMGKYLPTYPVSSGGGGAPPYRQNAEERVTPTVFVRNVEMVTKNSTEDLADKIKVRLKGVDGGSL